MDEQNRHHLRKEEISRFLDDELERDKHKKVEQHLKSCAHCRDTLQRMQLLQKAARRRSNVSVPASLWRNIERALEESDIYNNRSKKPLKFRTSLAAAVMLLAVLLGVLVYSQSDIDGFFTGCTMVVWENDTSAIDYGLYLSGLTQPSAMQQFNKKYNRRSVSLHQILQKQDSTVLTPPWKHLQTEMNSAYRLTNSVQILLRHPGGTLTLFQQPKDRPVKFSGYEMNPATIDSTECTKIETDQHEALMFHTRQSQYVLIGKKNDPMLTAVFDQLTKKH